MPARIAGMAASFEPAPHYPKITDGGATLKEKQFGQTIYSQTTAGVGHSSEFNNTMGFMSHKQRRQQEREL